MKFNEIKIGDTVLINMIDPGFEEWQSVETIVLGKCIIKDELSLIVDISGAEFERTDDHGGVYLSFQGRVRIIIPEDGAPMLTGENFTDKLWDEWEVSLSFNHGG